LQLNNLSSRSPLQPGHDYRIPLNSIGREQFEANRQEFHQQRMTAFLADYSITDVVKVKLRQGQSLWEIAQNNNVPMWLFYRENPKLLTGPVLAGAHITLPIVQAISHTGTPAGSR
ncbi:MAG: hypothetical protein OEW39_09620, partial [Deltaproteobacteria bacterium]|nr:hypothetical protein [Deltaproteobacteria bacterium]